LAVSTPAFAAPRATDSVDVLKENPRAVIARFCLFFLSNAKVAEYSSSRNCRFYSKPCKELASRASSIDCAAARL
jgi:hypothetical protein